MLHLQGEGDRHIPDLKPKHLFSGAQRGPALQPCHLHTAFRYEQGYRTGNQAFYALWSASATGAVWSASANGAVRCRQARERQDGSAVGRLLQPTAGRAVQRAAVLLGSAAGCCVTGCGCCMGKRALLHSLQSNEALAAAFCQQHWQGKMLCVEVASGEFVLCGTPLSKQLQSGRVEGLQSCQCSTLRGLRTQSRSCGLSRTRLLARFCNRCCIGCWPPPAGAVKPHLQLYMHYGAQLNTEPHITPSLAALLR